MSLEAKLLEAHGRQDKAALAELYAQAADQAKGVEAECFFLTQAYIFALDAGGPSAKDLHRRLKARGREQ